MPAYSGLRSRPSIHMLRQGSASFVASQAFVESVPQRAMVPAFGLVAALMIAGLFWIHDQHSTAYMAGVEAPVATGSIQTN